MDRAVIQHASLDWEDGTPVSRQFNDIYFSTDDGLEETRYVFLNGNHLPQRFATHGKDAFIVAETGFGTGLNFLTLWQAFDGFRQQHPDARLTRLHFISVEQFPLRAADLAKAQANWPALAGNYAELIRAWPLATPGCHRLILADGAVTLDLWFGEVNALLPEWGDSLSGQVDAWFLDGFAPAKNPGMWTPALFHAMARLAAPQGTFATFTSAGLVRRGLQAAGFAVEKVAGYGRKREMLTGRLADNAKGETLNSMPADNAKGEAYTDVPADSAMDETLTSTSAARGNLSANAPWFVRRAADHPMEVAIVGGGIAAALLADALQRRSARVTLYCADNAPARGASGNRQGALYPLLNNEDDELASFFANAFIFACQYYRERARLGVEFEHQWCGVTQLAYNQRLRGKLDAILANGWPAGLIRDVASAEMPALTGVATGCGGVTYPLGGWLNPEQLTTGMISLAQSRGMIAHYGHEVIDFHPDGDGWRLDFSEGCQGNQRPLSTGRHAHHQTVVLAAGHRMLQWPLTAPLPLTSVRGQVSHVPARPELEALRQVLCYDGYLTPQSPEFRTHCLGASACRDDDAINYRAEEQRANRDRLITCVPGQSWTQSVDISAGQARVSVRSSARDHLPMVGAVPDFNATQRAYAQLPALLAAGVQAADAPVYANLFMLGGLGSRGLCTAPLAAEILAGQIFGEPLPLTPAQSAALSPNRFWLRKLIKGRVV